MFTDCSSLSVVYSIYNFSLHFLATFFFLLSYPSITFSFLLQSKVFIYPRMFSLHDMTADTGLPSDNADVDDEVPTAGPNQVRLPAILNLSYERYVHVRGCTVIMYDYYFCTLFFGMKMRSCDRV